MKELVISINNKFMSVSDYIYQFYIKKLGKE